MNDYLRRVYEAVGEDFADYAVNGSWIDTAMSCLVWIYMTLAGAVTWVWSLTLVEAAALAVLVTLVLLWILGILCVLGEIDRHRYEASRKD